MTHDEAIQKVLPLGGKSRSNKKGFQAHLKFYEVGATSRVTREYPDIIFLRGQGVTDLVEVKVSRSDFKADKKKPFRKDPKLGMGRYRYMACPEFMIEAHEVPEGWGLIWIPEGRKAAYIKQWSSEFEGYNYEAERDLLFSLLRRINDFTPVDRLVEYDKIVQRDVAHSMNRPRASARRVWGNSDRPLTAAQKVEKEAFAEWDARAKEIKAIRSEFWDRLKATFKAWRN